MNLRERLLPYYFESKSILYKYNLFNKRIKKKEGFLILKKLEDLFKSLLWKIEILFYKTFLLKNCDYCQAYNQITVICGNCNFVACRICSFCFNQHFEYQYFCKFKIFLGNFFFNLLILILSLKFILSEVFRNMIIVEFTFLIINFLLLYPIFSVFKEIYMRNNGIKVLHKYFIYIFDNKMFFYYKIVVLSYFSFLLFTEFGKNNFKRMIKYLIYFNFFQFCFHKMKRRFNHETLKI